MIDNGELKEDIRSPDNELGEQISEEFESGKELILVVMSAMGEEHVMEIKEVKK